MGSTVPLFSDSLQLDVVYVHGCPLLACLMGKLFLDNRARCPKTVFG